METTQRTKRPYESSQQRLEAFEVKLVMVRDRTETTTEAHGHTLHTLEGVVSELDNLSSQHMPLGPFLKDLLSQNSPEIITFGQTCTLKTNCFVVSLLKDQVHQYDVCISPDDTSHGINHAVIGELVSQHFQSGLGGRFPAYDGRKRLYTSGPLPFTRRTFKIELKDEEDAIGRAPLSQKGTRLFEVVIKFVACLGLQPLDMDLAGGQEQGHQVALKALDIILRETFIGRRYPLPESVQLGEGLEIRQGFYKNLQLTQKGLLLNIDVYPTVSVKPIPVIKYIAQLLDRVILDRPLCDDDHTEIKKALEGLIVMVTHGSDTSKKYRVFGLTVKATRDLWSDPDNGAKFMHNFQEKNGYNIEYTCLPCLDVGDEKKPIYLPMEVCMITDGQQLSRKQKSALRELSRLHPLQRGHLILEAVNYYNEEPYAKEFGIKIETQLRSLNACVLPPPRLKFHNSGKTKDFLPEIGKWNMVRKRMLNGGRVRNWTCLNFSWDVTDKIITGFCRDLAAMCKASGMDFSPCPVRPVLNVAPEDVELALKSCVQDIMNILRSKGGELDLLIVILPDS